MEKESYIWDPETGVTICRLWNPDADTYAIGKAKCHPEDTDMMSKMTGEEIAYNRALIQLYRQKVKLLKKERKAHRDMYSTFAHTPGFDENNNYVRILKRKIYSLTDDIKFFDEQSDLVRKTLHDYIDKKTEFYNLTRTMRG